MFHLETGVPFRRGARGHRRDSAGEHRAADARGRPESSLFHGERPAEAERSCGRYRRAASGRMQTSAELVPIPDASGCAGMRPGCVPDVSGCVGIFNSGEFQQAPVKC